MSQLSENVATTESRGLEAMTIWPTIGATGLGRLVGSLASIRIGLGSFFTIGTLLAAVTIPISLAVFVWQLMPFVCRRYTLTDRRVIIRKGLSAVDETSIGLDEFDEIDVQVLPGQAWLRSGDLSFRRDGNEVFRLRGVSRPEVFRQVCLKMQEAQLCVQRVIREQAANESVAS